MVNLLGIARRAGVSREAVRLWATGKRGVGGFPKPALISSGGEQIWDWLEVAPGIERHQQRDRDSSVGEIEELLVTLANVNEKLRIFRTADRVLAARDALMSEPDKDVRQEFERLLEDALSPARHLLWAGTRLTVAGL